MLLAFDAWEAANGSAASSGISGNGLMRYRRVQVPLNVQLFHINIDDVEDVCTSRTRFIVDDTNELVNLLHEFFGQKISVTMQTEMNEKSECKLFEVDTIIRVFSSSGNVFYRFICDDGILRSETFAGILSDELAREEIAWSRNN